MAAAADPAYDLIAAIDTLMPGVVLQKPLLDAAAAQYQANGLTPITAGQVPAILAAANTLDTGGASHLPTTDTPYPTALPPFPTGMKRFADSNPSTRDGWSIDTAQDVP